MNDTTINGHKITDLPPSLRDELRLKHKKESETNLAAIVSVIEAAEVPLDTNEILVGLWSKTGTVFKRTTMHTALGKLARAGRIKKVGHGTYGPKTPRPVEVEDSV